MKIQSTTKEELFSLIQGKEFEFGNIKFKFIGNKIYQYPQIGEEWSAEISYEIIEDDGIFILQSSKEGLFWKLRFVRGFIPMEFNFNENNCILF